MGIAGLFIAIILNALIPQKTIDLSIHEALIISNTEFLKKIFLNLKLSGSPVYIPPYGNLEKGGIFIPSKNEFNLNLSAFDENIVFLTNQNASSEMGILITPPIGYELLEKYEENFGTNVKGLDSHTVFSLVSSSLSSMDLVSDIDFEEENDKIRVKIHKNDKIQSFNEFYYLSPIISSIFLAISKSKNVPIFVEEYAEFDGYFEFLLTELAKISKY